MNLFSAGKPFEIFTGREAREIMYLVASVCLCVCVSVRAFLAEPLNLKFGVKGGHYQSEIFVCVSVIKGHMRIISRMWSIGF